MEYLIYISTAKKLMADDELLEILTEARDNNERNNLTGILLYSEGTFIQLLEGEHDALVNTYKSIIKDPRHKNPIKLNEGNSPSRSFPDWTMGFKTISTADKNTLKGYFNPDKQSFDHDGSHLGLAMIKTFAESNRLGLK